MKIGNLEVYGIIYKIENLVNGKVYIGQTMQSNGFKDRYSYGGNGIERVYKHHRNNSVNGFCYNTHLLHSIDKYGLEYFSVSEVFDIAFSKEELDIKEKCWIKIYNSTNPNYGYNKADGGNMGGSPSIETRKKLSKSLKGVNKGKNPFDKMTEEEKKIRSYKWHKTMEDKSEEEKQRLRNIKSKNAKGKNNPMYGVHLCRDKNGSAKKVICLTTNKVFNCILDACDYYNCDKHRIINCCKKKTKHGGKLKNGTRLTWMYYEEYINLSKEELEEHLKWVNDKTKNEKRIKVFKNETFLGIFNSAKELEEQSENIFGINLKRNGIARVCRGEWKQYKGYTFKYINN